MLSQPLIDAVLHEIAHGRSTAIIPESQPALVKLMRQFEELLPPEIVERISRVNGQERMSLTNGVRIHFPRQAHTLRGANIGLAIVQGRELTEDEATHVIPALATSGGPILTRA